jgi:hypothetical protein
LAVCVRHARTQLQMGLRGATSGLSVTAMRRAWLSVDRAPSPGKPPKRSPRRRRCRLGTLVGTTVRSSRFPAMVCRKTATECSTGSIEGSWACREHDDNIASTKAQWIPLAARHCREPRRQWPRSRCRTGSKFGNPGSADPVSSLTALGRCRRDPDTTTTREGKHDGNAGTRHRQGEQFHLD